MWVKILQNFWYQRVCCIRWRKFTIVDVMKNKFSVALVPHTLAVTTFKNKQTGDKANIEVDILSRYVAKVLPQY